MAAWLGQVLVHLTAPVSVILLDLRSARDECLGGRVAGGAFAVTVPLVQLGATEKLLQHGIVETHRQTAGNADHPSSGS